MIEWVHPRCSNIIVYNLVLALQFYLLFSEFKDHVRPKFKN